MKKKKLGQFFTNELIAKFMARLVLTDQTKTVLDPAAGPGVFVKSVNEIKSGKNLHELESIHNSKIKNPCEILFDAYEIDGDMISQYRKNISFDTNLHHADYLQSDIDQKYDAIICNPPYNKFQEIKDREALRKSFLEKYHIKMSGYSNYCVYFLIKSLNELKENGRCAYIIPYEFLNTGYGTKIKEYMLKTKRLKSIIKFDNQLKLFEDAITTSCILYFEGSNNTEVHFIEIKSVDDIDIVNDIMDDTYSYSEIDPKEKWLMYFKSPVSPDRLQADQKGFSGNAPCVKTVSRDKEIQGRLVKLSSIGMVKRGIATGNNEYFGLYADKINALGLSEAVCLPCVMKAPDVDCLVLTKKKFREYVKQNKKMFLFDGERAVTEADFDYIRYGDSMGVNETYLTKNRTPWYKLENKPAAPILISVFNRNKLKVIRNEAMVKNLTAFHGLYPIFHHDEHTQEMINKINILFCYLLTPTAQSLLFQNKREYGEGLDKFEPNDLNNAKILDISLLTEHDRQQILKLYEQLKNAADHKTVINQLDKIFVYYYSSAI